MKQTLAWTSLAVLAAMALAVPGAYAADPEDSLVGNASGDVHLAAIPGIRLGTFKDVVNMRTTDGVHVTGTDEGTLKLLAPLLPLPGVPLLVEIKMTIAFDCLRVVGNRSIQRWHIVKSSLFPDVLKDMLGMSVGTDNAGTGQPDEDLAALPAAKAEDGVAPCSDADLAATVEQNPLAIKVIVTSGDWAAHDGLPD